MKVAYLPNIDEQRGTKRKTLNVFGGIKRISRLSDGDIIRTENICSASDGLPMCRKGHKTISENENCTMLSLHKGRMAVLAGESFFWDGIERGRLSPGEKVCVSMAERLIIFPDKAYYDSDKDEFGCLEAEYLGRAEFCDGSLYGEPAEANTVKLDSAAPFKAGDAVKIGGELNGGQSLIIREISGDGLYLSFYENSFNKGVEAEISIKREVPELDFLCVSGGRLWGAKGDTVYGSALGDPENFNVFDGLSTDSYSLKTYEGGDFSGCASFLSYPVFFKEDSVYKLYGSRPQNFELLSAKGPGVMKGSHKSICEISGRLFYLSPEGFCSYGGGIPELISWDIKDGVPYSRAVSLVIGRDYVSSLLHGEEREMLIYETETGNWYRCGDTAIKDASGNMALREDGSIAELFSDGCGTENGEPIPYEIVFAPIREGDAEKKILKKILLRCEGNGSTEIEISYDGGESFSPCPCVKDREGALLCSFVPRRSLAFLLRIKGSGSFKLCSFSRYYRDSTEL